MQVGRRDPLALVHPARTFWIVAVAVFVVDQLTKSVVRAVWGTSVPAIVWDDIVAGLVSTRLAIGENVDLLGEWFQLTHVRNTGAAFGLFPGYQPIFIATSLLVLLVVGVYWLRQRPRAWPLVFGTALVAGGAAGNLVDRAVIGKVTDFFYVAIIDFPVFNVADSAILIGVGMLILWLFFGPQPQTEASGPNSEVPVEVEPRPQDEAESLADTPVDSGGREAREQAES